MKNETESILYLNLKKEYFDLIQKGEKTSEFREYKKHWIQRLMNPDGSFKKYDYILFQNGYHKNAPQMKVEFKNIKIINEKVSLFKRVKYFEINLGQIIN